MRLARAGFVSHCCWGKRQHSVMGAQRVPRRGGPPVLPRPQNSALGPGGSHTLPRPSNACTLPGALLRMPSITP